MKNLSNGLFRVNVFTRAFQEFDEDLFFQKLHDQVKAKSFFEQYKNFKSTIVWLSYCFNLASAITASYAVFWFINKLTGIDTVAYLVALVFLFFLEKVKRKSSTEFWRVLFFQRSFVLGWFTLSLLCLSLSLASSGFGVKQGTEMLAPSQALLQADSMATYYRSEIAKLQKTTADLQATKNKEGITFYKLFDAINANTAIISDYIKRANELEKKLEGKNEQLSDTYQKEIQFTAWALVWLTLLMELLFEACIAYIWYYHYRSYVERLRIQEPALKTDFKLPDEKMSATSSPLLINRINALEQQIDALRASKTDYVHDSSKEGTIDSPESLKPIRQPIGFHSVQQTQAILKEKNGSGQASTDVDREISTLLEDKFTVAHTYFKKGEPKTVRYTMRLINSRVSQYEREVTDAIRKRMNSSIIENRKNWLSYWQNKKKELSNKMEILA